MYQSFFVKRSKCCQNIKIKESKKIYTFIAKTPNLLEVQCSSFFRFLKFGFQVELQRRQIWIQNPNLEWIFYSKRLYLEKPIRSYQETLRFGGNYRIRVLIPRSLYDCRNEKIRFEWVTLGQLPILTQQGYFLINGSPRVCITQMIRGPGVYANRKIEIDRKTISYIDFVPERGIWVRLEKDYDNQIWLRIRKEPRVPLWSVFQTIGLFFFPVRGEKNKRRNDRNFWEEKFLLDFFTSTIKKKTKYLKSKSLRSISDLFRLKKIKLLYITRKFSNIRTYDLGEVGRQRFNKQFQQIFPLSLRYLIPTDFLSAVKKLTKLNPREHFDDVDNLRTRRFRGVGELFQTEVRSALLRLERSVHQNLRFLPQDRKLNLNQIVPTEPFDQAFRHFVLVNPLLQFADQLNSLSELIQKRRLTGLGPGGLNLSNRKIEVRTIHPSHFGRLCPVETPEGQNAGIVNSPTLIRRLSQRGCFQTLIVAIQDGWIQFKLKISRISQTTLSWVSRRKGNWVTRIAASLLRNDLGQVQLSEISTRLDTEIENLSLIHRDQVKLTGIGPEQRLALAPNLIPFLEHDDRNRVLIGANILRQALPILKISVPRVSSRFGLYIRNDRVQSVRSRWSGLVCYVSVQRILIHSQINVSTTVCHHTTNNYLFQRRKKHNTFSYFFRINIYVYICCVEYWLGGVYRSNQSTWRFQRPSVQEGMWVQAGDLLADSSDSLCGQFVVGQNLLLGYIPWDGLNFEDAIIASETLITKEMFTSIHIEEWITSLKRTQLGIEAFVPFSKQLVDCISGRRTDSRFVFRKMLFFLSCPLVTKTNEIKLSKERILSLINRKKTSLRVKKIFLQTKQLNSSNKKIEVKSLNFLKKLRVQKIRKKNNLKNDFLDLKFLLSNFQLTRTRNRYEPFLSEKKLKTFFKKVSTTKYLKRNLSTFDYSQESKIRVREGKWNFTFPGYKDLDHRGLIRIGTWVESGQTLALRIRPLALPSLTPYEWLLFDVLEKKPPTIENVSFRVPDGMTGCILNVETFRLDENVNLKFLSIDKKWKDLLDPFFSYCKNEETIIEFWDTKYKRKNNIKFITLEFKDFIHKTFFSLKLKLYNNFKALKKIHSNKNNYAFVQKKSDQTEISIQSKSFRFFKKTKKILFDTINYDRNPFLFSYNSHRTKKRKNINSVCLSIQFFTHVQITIAIHRRLYIGDKVAGRHGNKGILARFLPPSEIPYLPNGISLDLVLNPLGIPSRINVGQVYEAVLSLAGFFLGEEFVLPSFDERSQIRITSRSLVFEKLREARIKTRQNWIFDLKKPGKIPLFDGRTGKIIEQDIAIGESYILKLIHMVDDKIHVRSTGPYSLITQQPLRGRVRNGGQRIGEIERWGLEGFGASYILQEVLTVKSDDLVGRGHRLLEALFQNRSLLVKLPDIFRVLACELQALCLDVLLFYENNVFNLLFWKKL